DNKICIWDIETGQKVGLFSGHEISDLALTPDDAYAMVCVWNGLKLINIKNRYLLPYAIAVPVTSIEAETREWKFRAFIDEATKCLENAQYDKVPAIVEKARAVKGYERDREALYVYEKAIGYFPKKGLLNAWELQYLKKHTAAVTAVALSADGSMALSGGADKAIYLWDMETGQLVREFKGHGSAIKCIKFSLDDQYVFSCDDSSIIYMWDVKEGSLVYEFYGHTAAVSFLDISPDGEFLLTASFDETIRLWEIKTRETIKIYKGHNNKVTAALFSPDMEFIVSCGYDETVRLWVLHDTSPINSYRVPDNPLWCISLPAHKSYVMAGGMYGGNIVLWNLHGKTQRTLRGHTDWINALCITMDGQFVLSASKDGTVRLWHVDSARCLRVFNLHSGAINSLSISAEARVFLAAMEDGTVRSWYLDWEPDIKAFVDYDISADVYVKNFLKIHTPYLQNTLVRRGMPEWEAEDFNALINELKHRGFGWLRIEWVSNRLIELAKSQEQEDLERTSTFQNKIKLSWEHLKVGQFREAIEEIKYARALKGYENDSRAQEILDRLACLCIRNRIHSARNVRLFEDHRGAINCLAFSLDNRMLLSASADGTLILRESSTGRIIHVLKGHEGEVTACLFVPMAPFVISAGMDKTIRMWSIKDGTCVRVFNNHVAGVRAIALGADGRFLFSGGLDKTIRLWEVETGNEVKVYKGLKSGVSAISMSPDGSSFVYSAGEPLVYMMDIPTGERQRVFMGHMDEVKALVFSPNGKYVASCGVDRSIKIWDMETAEPNTVFEGHDGYVNTLAYCPDGQFLLSGSSDGTLRIWQFGSSSYFQAFEGLTGNITASAFSSDGKYVLSGNHLGNVNMWYIEWDLKVKDFAQWDDGALPYIENFLTLHTPYLRNKPIRQKLAPLWTDEEFKRMVRELGCRGFGWLKPKGIRNKLVQMQERLVHQALIVDKRYSDSIRQAETFIQKRLIKEALDIIDKLRNIRDIKLDNETDSVIAALTNILPKERLLNFWKEKVYEDYTEIVAIAFNKFKEYLVVGTNDGVIKMLSMKTGDRLRILQGHKRKITGLMITPNGDSVLSTSVDGTLRLWDAESGECTHVFQGKRGMITALDMDSFGKYATVCFKDGSIKIWDMVSKENKYTMYGHNNEATSISLGVDVGHVLVGSKDGSASLWVLDEQVKLPVQVFNHENAVTCVRLSANSKYAITGSADGTIKVWDVATDKTVYTCSLHTKAINAIDITNDAKYMVSVSADTTIRLWDINTGECLRVMTGHTKPVTCVQLSADGRYLVAGGQDYSITFWYLEWQLRYCKIGGWDDGVKPYLKNFVHRMIFQSGKTDSLIFSDDDIVMLSKELQMRGFGWVNMDMAKKTIYNIVKQLNEEPIEKKSWFSKIF
ncbi:MAG: WD40 repeat domain-containing protein, partial [Candidatus Magnetoovum sp. WYHC-5]|nr:WD40 repeat domain-containing protein [Candidatus Magnetoovum sp. WYHC-5]